MTAMEVGTTLRFRVTASNGCIVSNAENGRVFVLTSFSGLRMSNLGEISVRYKYVS